MRLFRNSIRLAVFGVLLAFMVVVPATALALNVSVGGSPTDIDFDTVLNKAFVANYYGQTVSVIDASDAVVATIDARTYADPNPSYPNAIAVDSVMHRAYVGNYVSPDIVVIDTATNVRLTAVSNPGGWNNFAKDVLVDEGRNLVYVANWNGGVEVYRGLVGAPYLEHVASVPCGLNPCKMAIDPASGRVYVVNANGNSVSVIEGTNLSAPSVTLPVGTYPAAVAVNPVSLRVYVANYSSNDVTVIDGAASPPAVLVPSVPVGIQPQSVAIDYCRNAVYVANLNSHNVTTVDGATNVPVNTTAVGAWPQDVAVDVELNRVLTANSHPAYNNIAVFEPTKIPVFQPAGSLPWIVRVNPAIHKVYALNKDSNDVTIFDLPRPTDVEPGQVAYTDPLTQITVRFNTVITAGRVQIQRIGPAAKNPAMIPPANWALVGDYYYEIITDAVYTGPVQVTFPMPAGFAGNKLSICHWTEDPLIPGTYTLQKIKVPAPPGAPPWPPFVMVQVPGLSTFALFEEPDDVVTTPASSPWSLALLAAVGLGALPVIKRAKSAV